MTNLPRRTGTAHLPLHGGKAPAWLFSRMTKLAREITIAIVSDFGPQEMLYRLSDPYWFQAFGCVLGFDWHSSGVTTTVCGAIKEGIRGMESDLGFFVAGGKGGASRKTPAEIENAGPLIQVDTANLVYASRMSAKVDNNALQDGYQLYHHVFCFTKNGDWAVIQQGMNEENRYARRYHWLGEKVSDFVCEPHSAICAEATSGTLNLVAEESGEARETISDIARQENPDKIMGQLKKLQGLELPRRHEIIMQDIHPDRLYKIFVQTYEKQPENFERLLGMAGVGAKTLRALSLISEIIYGAPVSFRDPARFSFAHGGKDGIPYPVDKKTYDRSIEILHNALERARIEDKEKIPALRRLKLWL
ncbi:MAG: DUF763 domain-containing protein [Dehalococcoidia bacterium]|nr:DUF763 domain-containing protein [Dehalococcoidia bacterium]MDD5494764.1 DUF763 domain-containing protein [Dehalococcoidia bacterium]